MSINQRMIDPTQPGVASSGKPQERQMTSFTTIRDVQTWVDAAFGGTSPSEYGTTAAEVARRISDAAHASGLRYGTDWSAFLETPAADVFDVAARIESEKQA